jgi:hypothetical protein
MTVLRGAGALVAVLTATAVVAVVAVPLGTGRVQGPPLRLAPASAAGSLAAPPAAGPLGPELVAIPPAPPLARAGSPRPGHGVGGVGSAPLERLAFHIHAHLTIVVDGRYRGDPRRIPLLSHAQIQLDVGRPVVAPERTAFPSGL